MIQTFRQFSGLLAALSIVILGNGLYSTLTPLRAVEEHFAPLIIGLLGSVYYVGYVLSCWQMPRLLRRIGHVRSFAALSLMVGLVTLLQGLFPVAWFWLICRFFIGVGLAGVFVITESWLNDQAGNANRGAAMSAYTILFHIAFAGGQALAGSVPVKEYTLFAVVSVLSFAAILPILRQGGRHPHIEAITPIRWGRLVRLAPVGLSGSFIVGAADAALWSQGPIYGLGHGFSDAQAAGLMSLLVAAGALGQWPFARLSDRIDRRLVLIGAGAGALLLALGLVLVTNQVWLIYLLMGIFGFFVLSLYAISASCAYDEAGPGGSVEMASAVLLVNGVGAVIGPFVASYLMVLFGPNGLVIFLAGILATFISFVGWRLSITGIDP